MPPPERTKRQRSAASAAASAASLEAALFHDPNAAAARRYSQLINTAGAFDNAWYRRTFPAFNRYTKSRDGRAVDVLLSYCTADELTAEQREAVFQITKTNMRTLSAAQHMSQSLYDECDSDGWKWNDSKKRRELHHPDARFLIATPFPASSPSPPPPTLPTASPIGFLHLRYLLENELPVLYAYEMQVADDWQRLGLGSQLMRVGQLLSVQAGMACVMLTVFKRNVAGMQLYKKTLGYVVDELSQSDHEGEDYEVLSKKNPKFVAG